MQRGIAAKQQCNISHCHWKEQPRGDHPPPPQGDEEMRREQSCALFGMPLLLPLLLLMMIMVMLGDGRGAARG